MNLKDILYSTKTFVPYSQEYFIALVLFIIIGVFLVWKGKNSPEGTKPVILKFISFLLSSAIIIWAIIEILLGRFYLETDLPLIFCNFTALVLPLFAYNRRQHYFNILYYIIFAGAIQAIVTPGLKFGFPHYEFIKFWTVHVGLIVFVVYEMVVLGILPTKNGIWQTFIFVQVYVVIVIGINWILDSNYLFLNIKPEHGSLLDLLGGWPWYIVLMDVVLIPYFLILYLPVWFYKRKITSSK